MRRLSLIIIGIWAATTLCASAKSKYTTADSAKVTDIEEVIVIATPKETDKLKQQPLTVSLLGQEEVERHGIQSLKGTSEVVPNLFIPDYGSRLTSAIYIRGIGSRINTPAVGLYVDNVPYYDKSAYDFNLYDIERIDVLRGPQGTLYGRNSMGGLIRIHTRSPFAHKGSELKLGLSSGDLHRRASLTHYHRISDKFAFSGSGYYEGSNGFHKNSYSGHRQDRQESGGVRMRGIALPTDKLKLDFNLGYDYTHEGGYPYFYTGQVEGEETHADLIGKISANEQSSYRRGMINAGLNIEYRTRRATLNAVTGFQHLQDRMFLDQDFISDNVYTLEQRQRLTILSEEVTIKSNGRRFWQWVNGLSASQQWLRTTGPVTFKEGGVEMLTNTINSKMPDLANKGIIHMGVTLNDPTLTVGGRFQTPTTNIAIFHQSTLNLTDQLSATIGARLDYEHNSLTYNAPGLINYDFTMQSTRMPLKLTNLKANPIYEGHLRHDYLEVLPKTAIRYKVSKNILLYISAAKGHRSGGYNVQMFNELMQSAMRNKMMQGIKDGATQKLEEYASHGMPAAVINMIKNGLDLIPLADNPDVAQTVRFKPEYSWTYELGSRMTLLEKALNIDFALFYSTIRNQQVSRFVQSGLGRMMVNAGRSRSYGLELGIKYAPTTTIQAWANYGFTHAVFTRYDAGNDTDYTGNRVPFIPKHTLNLGADYVAYKSHNSFNGNEFTSAFRYPSLVKSVTLGASFGATGRIYWNESNTASQALYTTVNAHALIDFGSFTLNLWGRNLTNRHYQTFYFESMNRGYEQKGRPIQVGFDLKVLF